MTQRDIRCLLSGVSLLNSEAAMVFVLKTRAGWRPISLPLWGRYEGWGSLSDVGEGPNSDLILSAVQEGVESGRVSIDFEALGQPKREVDDIESFANLVACSQVPELDAIRWDGSVVGFALLSAHVAAAMMQGEPTLTTSMRLEELPSAVLPERASQDIYGPLCEAPLGVRLKFGLSFVALAALEEQMRELGMRWVTSRVGIALEDRLPEQWLSQAMIALSDRAELLEALGEHVGADPEDEASWVDD